ARCRFAQRYVCESQAGRRGPSPPPLRGADRSLPLEFRARRRARRAGRVMVAKRTHSSIGDVLNQLRDEFPDITISKIRFLESQGLVDPERTPSGYRKFYPADVERLRFILRQQREHFLPLKVIKERLDEVDADGGFAVTAPAEGAGADRIVDPATVDALFEETRRAAQSAEARSASAAVRDEE